jgi:hypothetical protein
VGKNEMEIIETIPSSEVVFAVIDEEGEPEPKLTKKG